MMLMDNLPRILAETANCELVLDVGGSAIRLNTATHVVDLLPPSGAVIAPGQSMRPAEWVHFDICRKPWPFPDGLFDFAFCSHTLEDVRDPIGACEELMRVAKRGYIEVPSREREIFHTKPMMRLRSFLGRPLRAGFGHHRWFCELEANGLVFTAKTFTAALPGYMLTQWEVGRKLTPSESAIGFFWNGAFPVIERVLIQPGETEAELASFKARARMRLTQKSG
jgi:hypothetical protein